jgi:integral membrane protein
MLQHPIGRLRLAGLLEGTSFLVLLGVAMPLKYLADLPMAVKVVGWAHGILFMVFCLALLHAKDHADWPLSRAVKLFVAALLPFGPFVVDRGLRAEQAKRAG